MPTVTQKGQVTIPLPLREKLGLQRGDQVIFEERGGEVIIKKAPRGNPFEAYVGHLGLSGVTSDQLVSEMRDRD